MKTKNTEVTEQTESILENVDKFIQAHVGDDSEVGMPIGYHTRVRITRKDGVEIKEFLEVLLIGGVYTQIGHFDTPDHRFKITGRRFTPYSQIVEIVEMFGE